MQPYYNPTRIDLSSYATTGEYLVIDDPDT